MVTRARKGRTESRLQADSPSTRTFVENRVENDSNVTQSALGFSDAFRQALASRLGTGGDITWLSPPARSAQSSGARRDRSAHQGRPSAPKDKGGIGEAKAELERFVAELAVGTPTERTTVTVSEMLQAYLAHCKRVGRTRNRPLRATNTP